MKTTKVLIEIERPSIAPTCFKEEPDALPEGLTIELSVHDDNSLWGSAHWRGRVVRNEAT